MRFFVNHMLRGTLVHVCMRLELEKQVQHVNQQKDLSTISGDVGTSRHVYSQHLYPC